MLHLMVADETNQQASAEARFFIYGGVVVRSDKIRAITEGVDAIRKGAGYSPTDELKFETRSRPSDVTPGEFNRAKDEILGLCYTHGVRFLAYVVHHDIAAKQPLQRRHEWAANTILGCFNRYCEAVDGDGIVLFDRIPGDKSWAFLREKHQRGLLFGARHQRLDRLHGFAMTCSGASHLSALCDVVLGAFRFCVNSSENQQVTASSLLRKVVPLLWYRYDVKTSTAYLREFGLLFRPKQCAAQYQLSYVELSDKISRLCPGPVEFLDEH